MRVLVTGANGFVGRNVCRALLRRGDAVRAAVRRLPQPDLERCGEGAERAGQLEIVAVGDLTGETDWRKPLEGADAVVHLAARVHVLRETEADPLAAFRLTNVAATENLARQASERALHRFLFLSSVAVHGRAPALPLTEGSPVLPDPAKGYAVSKAEAEERLRAVVAATGLKCVIVRPPMVYGPGAPGNLPRLLRLVRRGVPLPLGSVRNRRSWIFIDNLVDFLLLCLDHPSAAGETFVVSDDDPLSTPDLLRHLAVELNVPSRVFPFPLPLLNLAGTLAGAADEVRRLTESMTVDASRAKQQLGWKPPLTLNEGLSTTIRSFRSLHPSEGVERRA